MNIRSTFKYFIPFLSVFIAGVYPVVYLYVQNTDTVLISSLVRLLPYYLLLSVLIFSLLLIINRGNPIKAANASIVFLIIFNSYGILFENLVKWDIVEIKHYSLLPLCILVAITLMQLVSRLKIDVSKLLWRILSAAFAGLTLFSLIRVVPYLNFERKEKVNIVPTSPTVQVNQLQSTPDIYYLVFDEFSSFKAMREYWDNEEVDKFKLFLEEKGFFVAEDVVGTNCAGICSTVYQLAMRLNYVNYPEAHELMGKYMHYIADNQAMAFLKSKGYTTMVIEGLSRIWPNFPEIQADYLYNIFSSGNVSRILYDDFSMLIASKTMLSPISHAYRVLEFKNDVLRKFLLFTIEKVSTGGGISSPKFIFVHFLAPHQPYLMDADGKPIEHMHYQDWDYYYEYYVWTITIMEDMVTDILENADPANPPVIILQSDHGARFLRGEHRIDDFPLEYKNGMLFSMYLPGYDTSTLAQDLDPINTLPIVFNHYLGTDIPLQ